MTCGGADVLSAHLTIPIRGPWTAEVVLDTATNVTGSVTLSAQGGLSLRGAVAWGQVNPALQQWEGVIVGGAGGLSRTVSGAYQYAQLRDPLAALLQQAGETQGDVAADVLAVSLQHFSMGQWTAAAALEQLAAQASKALGTAINWRPMSDGRIWIGAETWPTRSLATGEDVLDPAGADRRVTIGAQTPALLPGVALDGVGRVIAVDHWIDAYAVRTWAWTEGGYDSAAQFRRMVRAALGLDLDAPLQLDRLALYRAEVKARAANGSTVDLQPTNPLIPPIQNVPVRVSIPSATFKIGVGSVCRLGWDDGDPAKPYAVPAFDLGGTLDEMTIAGGTKGVARDGDAVELGQCYVTVGAGAVTGVFINGTALPVASDPAPTTTRGRIKQGSSKVKVG